VIATACNHKALLLRPQEYLLRILDISNERVPKFRSRIGREARRECCSQNLVLFSTAQNEFLLFLKVMIMAARLVH
jgi:hypothetical protein